MPDALTHRAQVEHNKMAAIHLLNAATDLRDWVVTTYFYAAVHAVDQVLFVAEKLHPRNHAQRKAAIARQVALASVRNDYLELEHQSRLSRYECRRFTEAEVKSLAARLNRIEQQIVQLVPSL